MVVSFDAATTVTAARQWRADPRWRQVASAEMSALRALDQLIVFAAHPDDETLGAGGLLATAADLSLPVRVIVATGDEQLRREELASALDELGVNGRIDFLEFPDGALKRHADHLAAAIRDILAGHTGAVWAVAPWPGDRHGDHRTLGEQVAKAAKAARAPGVEVFFYPVWLWQWAIPDECPWEQLLEVPISASVRRRKRSALACFHSQIRSSANPDGVLTAEFLGHFHDGREVLIDPSRHDHFEEIHTRSEDPWSVRTRSYERRKRAITIASLPRERFSRALEIGCSIGEVSAELVDRCDDLLAIDGSESAVAAARKRLHGRTTATVLQGRVPDEWPQGVFDLIVISEVAYYLPEAQWRATIQRCRESITPDGVVVLCHWLGAAEDFAQTGERVHTLFREESRLRTLVVHRESEFLLEVFAAEGGVG